MKTSSYAIQLKDITKNYLSEEVTTKVLHDVSLTVNHGEFIAITGPSGSGKSTLLNILGLLDSSTSGTYVLNGTDVTRLNEDEVADVRNQEIGFVFQSFNLLKNITVLENVILPAIYRGTRVQEREAKAKALLTRVGLENHMYKRPNQLSGGQQQRVAISRALMNDPAILLADEPTGNLDSQAGTEIMKIFRELHKQGNTIIMITHEKDIAKQAERIVFIRDGKIIV